MRVLIVNTTERTGGAAIAANRLAKALRQEGAEVSMLCQSKGLSFFTLHLSPFTFYWERLRIFLANRLSRHNLWQIDIACCGEDITQRPEFQQADVVHLHWVNQGFLSLRGIEKILKSGKRIVWTLHDQWPYTGICHYAETCDRFQTQCHDCPLLKTSKPQNLTTSKPQNLTTSQPHDLSQRVFEAKRRIYRKGSITFVGCSQWIADEARKSPLTEGHRVVCIPNAIDHATFRPVPKQEARQQFGLPDDKPIVLFICQKVTDERKGIRYLEEAMKQLPDVRVVRVGKGGDYEIADERRMALLYAAADVFVTPSLQDNLPNTIVEAMSCGTPCVGFRVGGIPEMIHHQTDGYVARYRDADDLARGIRYVLAHPELSAAAVQYARETYDEHRVAQRYIEEYEAPLPAPPVGGRACISPQSPQEEGKPSPPRGERGAGPCEGPCEGPDFPLITIITVTYNAEKTIERTLQSVENQTYPRIEHLIIDGCSTDHTLSHVQRYVERNGQKKHLIRVLREPDNGLYDAMNKGINLASGDYLVFLNAGDRLHEPSTIEQIVSRTEWQGNSIRSNPFRRSHGSSKNYAVLYGETDLVDNEGRFLRHRRLQTPERLTSHSFLQGMLVCHQSFYVRTDIARAEPYDLRYRYSADYDWCIRVMRRAERRRLRFLNTHLILTDYLNEGLTTQNHRRSLLERLRLMAHHYGWPQAILHHLWFFLRAIIKR